MNQPELELILKNGPIRLETSIKPKDINGRTYFVSQVTIFKNNEKISSINDISEVEFDEIVTAYRKEIDNLEKKDKLLLVNIERKRGFVRDIRNIFLVLKIAFSSLNVIMLDDVGPVARTTIELDADIITVLRSDLDNRGRKRLFRVQGINVYFINKFFRLYIFNFMSSVRRIIFYVNRIIIGVGTFTTLFYFVFKTIDHVRNNLLDNPELVKWVTDPVIFSQIIIPIGTFLLFKYWRKILGFILQRLIQTKIGSMLTGSES